MIVRKSAQEIAKMAAAGRLVAETIAHVGEQIEPGITTGELDRIAEEHIRSHGGVPTSQGYRGYPRAICISPNSMVVHGIPGAYEVEDGDPLSQGTNPGASVGVDLKYMVTPALTLTATLNPDFGQVEADPAAVNLDAFLDRQDMAGEIE